ncbi:thiosulfate oxidation carrier protein SoxY [Sulfuricurvum sp.]|uniref:thiosulfate oxidation carrier protein SoxY n=1 Tax=Sulfuricurvum sp. TaxID=2025608 RepID=UPI002625733E|nr:thiosulfate oxidation carrier protein SoxY [Sulfuricurvum sp.]MDD2266752.1 thiosulfate oxidation carrier protein SoxY [Sulfuricurvum sp.]
MATLFRKYALLFLLLSASTLAQNPIYSPTFDDLVHDTLHTQTYFFDDENITITVPKFADNPSQVPVSIDASKIKNPKRMVVFADLNYIPEIMDVDVLRLKPIFSFNIRVAQETPIRVLVQDDKGLWHIGSKNIKSPGGGCASASPEDNKKFALLQGKSKSHTVRQDDSYAINFSIYHPMETGLMFGTAPFYIKHLNLYSNKELIGSMDMTSAISQNPVLTLYTSFGNGNYTIDMEDTDANEYHIQTKFAE